MEHLPFVDEKFDAIIVVSAIHHANLSNAIKEISSGLLLIDGFEEN